MNKNSRGSSQLVSSMDKTNYLSQSGSDIFDLSTSNLDLGSSDFLETKKRGRQ